LKDIGTENVTALAWEFAEKVADENTNKAAMEKMGIPALDLLETRLRAGGYIDKSDVGWTLRDKDGKHVTYGTSIRQLLVNLIFVDC
jgi:hypothetical protein